MKLLFVYDLIPEHALHWRDGLWAALKELEKEWELEYLNLAEKETSELYKYDFALGWGGAGSRVADYVTQKMVGSKGLCFGGGDINDLILDRFDVVFVENESQLIKPNFRHAFGTNTRLFIDRPEIPKFIDALYPAAFAAWTHQEIFASICYKEKLRGLAVGYVQQNNLGESLWLQDECIQKGVATMDWVPARTLVDLYNMSKEVIITADSNGGSERAVLEAKACGVPVRVVSDSEKLHVLNKLTTEEVREKWNHIEYARKLREGINERLDNRL